jgi:hypothetical protein
MYRFIFSTLAQDQTTGIWFILCILLYDFTRRYRRQYFIKGESVIISFFISMIGYPYLIRSDGLYDSFDSYHELSILTAISNLDDHANVRMPSLSSSLSVTGASEKITVSVSVS